MKKTFEKVLTFLLAAVMTLGLMVVNTGKVCADDQVINIDGLNSVQISNKVNIAIIDIYDGGDGNGTITVIGYNSNLTEPITLNIAKDVKVVWKAKLITADDDNYNGDTVINLATHYGPPAVFEFAEDALIKVNFTMSGSAIASTMGSVPVEITGGEIIVDKGIGSAVFVAQGGVTMTGGTIQSSSTALSSMSAGSITVTGGLITSNTNSTISTNSGNITITGGQIETKGAVYTIYSNRGNIVITGGKIISDTMLLSFHVMDGIGLYLEGTCDGRFSSYPNGCVFEIKALLVPKALNGTDKNIAFIDSYGLYSATAVWKDSGSVPQIEVTRNTPTPTITTINWGEYEIPKYALTVVNGTGDGDYAAGTKVSVVADTPASNQVFDIWMTSAGGSFINDRSTTTKFTMPANDVTVTAAYKNLYKLTIVNGVATGENFEAGSVIPITADPAPSGMVFDKWESSNGGSFSNIYSTTTNFTMPANATTVTAKYKAITIPVTGVNTLTKVYIKKGKTVTLPMIVKPDNASNKAVSWTSANEKIATVDPVTGKVKGKKKGNTIIAVTTEDGTKTAECKVYVVTKAKKVKKLTISPTKYVGLGVGQTQQIQTKISPAKATGVIPTYTSSNPSVAVIDKMGLITALSPGKTKITVKAGSKKKSFVLTVGAVAPVSISLIVDELTLNVKESFNLNDITWNPDNSDPKEVTWTTSNKKIVKIDKHGIIQTLKKGKATITATTWNGKTAQIVIIVQ